MTTNMTAMLHAIIGILAMGLITAQQLDQPATLKEPVCPCKDFCLPGPQGVAGPPGASGPPGVGVTGPQGVAGPSGNHGIPGANGQAGGEKGEKGDTSKEKMAGLPGPPGVTGSNGQPGQDGSPGQTGSKGPVGRPGETGRNGLKGEKGESGHIRKSAFTAVKSNAQTGHSNDVVTFQTTTVNTNSHFSLSSNKFTCQFPGVYFFTYSIGVYQPADPKIQLVKNNNFIVSGHTRTIGNSDFDQTGNSALLNLQKGDQVWLRFSHGSKVYSNSSKYSSFSGFLLYEM